jgi:ribosomal protein S18 acetylase RimI-like enzyme
MKRIEQGDVRAFRELLLEYGAGLGIDLSFQHFAEEVAMLPGAYAGPDGRMLLAYVDDELAGCIAMRKIDGVTCEMKRLYVRKKFRGSNLGRELAVELMRIAAERYQTMLLDTLPTMQRAIELYRSLGFTPRDPYGSGGRDDLLYFEKRLR